ncbi:hypothetical protein K435DRAFT_802722 [Dendrothele bispora CBS 962.96]|uniref:Uncharacterized protein n=1 Tax=Dendrothele bispora (strain CBS 962.96) TaxID=1314807 RepID=A0A4S8LK30_DENBC|nr:hypothetical protein K435DRAFT_802722 [Dendrothele bispora CBS 962.96]
MLELWPLKGDQAIIRMIILQQAQLHRPRGLREVDNFGRLALRLVQTPKFFIPLYTNQGRVNGIGKSHNYKKRWHRGDNPEIICIEASRTPTQKAYDPRSIAVYARGVKPMTS